MQKYQFSYIASSSITKSKFWELSGESDCDTANGTGKDCQKNYRVVKGDGQKRFIVHADINLHQLYEKVNIVYANFCAWLYHKYRWSF